MLGKLYSSLSSMLRAMRVIKPDIYPFSYNESNIYFTLIYTPISRREYGIHYIILTSVEHEPVNTPVTYLSIYTKAHHTHERTLYIGRYISHKTRRMCILYYHVWISVMRRNLRWSAAHCQTRVPQDRIDHTLSSPLRAPLYYVVDV